MQLLLTDNSVGIRMIAAPITATSVVVVVVIAAAVVVVVVAKLRGRL